MKLFNYIALSCLLVPTARAGWVVTYENFETGERSQEYYEADRANFDGLIYSGDLFIVVDRNARAYWMGPPERYCNSLKTQLMRMQSMIPAQFREKPISQRDVTRNRLGTKSIAGFSATGWDFFIDGNQEERVWISSDSGLSEIIEYERSYSKNMKCFEEMESDSLEGSKLYKQTVEGAFILGESYRQVVSVERKSVNSSHFGAPEGYKAFSDYDEFVRHVDNRSGASTMSSTLSFEPQPDMPEHSTSHESKAEPDKGEEYDGSVENAEESTDDKVDVNRGSTKVGDLESVSDDFRKSVDKLLDKWF